MLEKAELVKGVDLGCLFWPAKAHRKDVSLRGGPTAPTKRKSRRLRTFNTGLLNVLPGWDLET